MYLKITEQAQERLQKYIDEGATVILVKSTILCKSSTSSKAQCFAL
ncbi:TPA: iron-sulfur cluster biosynthesis family protein [Enterococcus faecium]|nr:iron-sulfur cluster biosynthesis family protein [Enterococcus faecium]